MLINELSKITGITSHTIRFYEKCGLIKGFRKEEVKTNKYFHYDEEVVEKLQLIKDAKSIGFTLSEINQLTDAWYNNKLTVIEKLEVLNEKLSTINEKIHQLKEMKNRLDLFKKSVRQKGC